MQDNEQILRRAAATAGAAPSIFNTQPWRWEVSHDRLRLWADRGRQLLIADPTGRLLTISCGASLHHAALALAACGRSFEVCLLPDEADPDLLAELAVTGTAVVSKTDTQMFEAIAHRRTDRRGFTMEPVPAAAAQSLVSAAAENGAGLLLLGDAQIDVLARAAYQVAAAQRADQHYRHELVVWTHRPEWSGDGVPVATTVEQTSRRVPVRDFAPFNGERLATVPQSDAGARYGLIFTDADDPSAWLHAGQALSAVLLAATAAGLATAPISDVTELNTTRSQLAEILPRQGFPQIAVRIGHSPGGRLPSAPRRDPADITYP